MLAHSPFHGVVLDAIGLGVDDYACISFLLEYVPLEFSWSQTLQFPGENYNAVVISQPKSVVEFKTPRLVEHQAQHHNMLWSELGYVRLVDKSCPGCGRGVVMVYRSTSRG